jgi:hypothetical protein
MIWLGEVVNDCAMDPAAGAIDDEWQPMVWYVMMLMIDHDVYTTHVIDQHR